MKIRDLIDIVDIDRASGRLVYELLRPFCKEKDISSDELIALMYGDEEERAEKELQREKLRSEIRKMDADALNDVADLGLRSSRL